MIILDGVSKQYSGRPVVNNISLSIPGGSVFGFLGVNGAGKTTTLKMIVGLSKPDMGSISIGDGAISLSGREVIGFMPEGPYFYENLTGLEFLRFCGKLFKSTSNKQVDYYRSILDKVNLAESGGRRIKTYSKGMRQRLGFAQALVNDPAYVFLDEPLDGLDPIGRREIKKIIGSMRSSGKTVFLNSHILSDIEEICDRISVIHDGKIAYEGGVDSFCGGMPLEERFVELIGGK